MDPLVETNQQNENPAEQHAAQAAGPAIDDPVRAIEQYHRYVYASRFVRNRKVMEISCGEGYGTAFLSINAEEVVGVDADEASIARAKETYKEFPKARFVAARPEEYDLSEPRYDVVVSFGTLERLGDPERERFIGNIKRALKPGGVLLLSSSISDGNLEDIADRGESRTPEFSAVKFSEFVKRHFASAIFLGQRPITVSSLYSLYQWQDDIFRFHTRDNLFTLPPDDEQFAIPYGLIAVCSMQPLPREIADNSKSLYYDVAQVKRSQELFLRSRRLESEVGTLRESVSHLLKDEAERTELLIRLQRDNSSLREEIEEKMIALEDRETKIAALDSDLANARAAHETLQQAYDIRSARANKLKDDYSCLEERVNDLQAAVIDRDEQLVTLGAEAETLRTSLMTVQSELNDRTVQHTQDRGELERASLQVSELTEQVRELTSLASVRADELRSLTMQIAELRSVDDEREQRIHRAEEELAETREALRQARQQVSELSEQEQFMVRDEQSLRSRVEELEATVRQQSVAIEFEKEENQRLERSLAESRERLAAQEAEIESRKADLAARSNDLDEYLKLADERMAAAEEMKARYGGREEEIRILQDRLGEQMDISTKRFEELELLKGELASVTLRVNEKAGIAEIAKKELEASREQMAHLHREGSERTQKIAQLENRIKEQTEFLTKLQREADEQSMAARHLKSELDRQVIAFDTYQKSQSDLQQRYTKSQIRVQELQAWGAMLEQKLNRITSGATYKMFSSLGMFPNDNG